jgi:hypothetical protein
LYTMVSKQKKYLRQQAIARAEKYKEEQAQKVQEHEHHAAAQCTALTPAHA